MGVIGLYKLGIYHFIYLLDTSVNLPAELGPDWQWSNWGFARRISTPVLRSNFGSP